MKSFPGLLNRFFVWLQRSDIKGKYSFYKKTKDFFSDKLIIHDSAAGKFAVPYDQWCFWQTRGPANYYLEELAPFCSAINDYLGEFDFIDLGADVGVVSHLVANNCCKNQVIYAFEPNPISFKILEKNSQSSLNRFLAINKAISSFNGVAKFIFDDSVKSDHEGHLEINRTGSTAVSTLDNALQKITLNSDLAIKIDVEGQEAEIFKGAQSTLKKCEKAVILLEIHPDTLKRDGLTPEDIFDTMESIRKCRWHVPLLNKTFDRSAPFFEQFPIQQYDLIGYI